MSAKKFLASMASAYDVKLPKRYRDFLESGEHKKHSHITLSGYFQGPYDLDFLDEDLADIAELGNNAGIYDMDDVPWADDYAAYVPLASMTHPEVDEPKMFLVLDVESKKNPVFIFGQEGWKLYPIAKSFDEFVDELPKAHAEITDSFRPGDEDDDGDEDDEDEDGEDEEDGDD
ncbi:MAG: SMI1/KNR4 family protein [Polyangiaceae bacterium]